MNTKSFVLQSIDAIDELGTPKTHLQWTTIGPSVSLDDCEDFCIKANNCPAVSGVPWSGQDV